VGLVSDDGKVMVAVDCEEKSPGLLKERLTAAKFN